MLFKKSRSNDYMLQRSMIEHHLLPDQFYDNPKQFIVAMAEQGQDILYSIYDKVFPNKFKKESFKTHAAPNKMGGISVILRLPDPDVELACPFIGLSLDQNGESPSYYTIERTAEGGFLFCCKPDKDSHAILRENCGTTPKEHVTVLMKYLSVGV